MSASNKIIPGITAFTSFRHCRHHSYSTKKTTEQSESDVQQGTPLGSLPISLTLGPIILKIREPVRNFLQYSWYLDKNIVAG